MLTESNKSGILPGTAMYPNSRLWCACMHACSEMMTAAGELGCSLLQAIWLYAQSGVFRLSSSSSQSNFIRLFGLNPNSWTLPTVSCFSSALRRSCSVTSDSINLFFLSPYKVSRHVLDNQVNEHWPLLIASTFSSRTIILTTLNCMCNKQKESATWQWQASKYQIDNTNQLYKHVCISSSYGIYRL